MAKRKEQTFAQRMVLTIAASFIMAFTIKSFARPGGIFSGGFNGISLLIIACCEKFLSFSPFCTGQLQSEPHSHVYQLSLSRQKADDTLYCLRCTGWFSHRCPARCSHYIRPTVGSRIRRYLQWSIGFPLPACQWLGRRHRYYRAFYGRNQGAGLLECNLYDECRSAWSCRCPVWLG